MSLIIKIQKKIEKINKVSTYRWISNPILQGNHDLKLIEYFAMGVVGSWWS